MINGNTLRDALLSGANNIVNCKKSVDELNVFPVPDGDTGTNMSMTISNAARELILLDNETAGKVAAVNASAQEEIRALSCRFFSADFPRVSRAKSLWTPSRCATP